MAVVGLDEEKDLLDADLYRRAPEQTRQPDGDLTDYSGGGDISLGPKADLPADKSHSL